MKLFNLHWFTLLMLWHHVKAFSYLPDAPARSFRERDLVPLMVNKLTSINTQVPIDYYSLPFCHPEAAPIQMANENMGQLLRGYRIQNSPYVLLMKQETFCKQLCIANLDDQTTVDAIEKNYHHNWIVDNLSAASKEEDENTVTTRYWQGFPVGYVDDSTKKAYIHNHVNIEIMYHAVETETDKYRVVRFMVEPFSIKHDWNHNKTTVPVEIRDPIDACSRGAAKAHTNWDMVNAKGREAQEASGKVLFTYDVTWIENRDLRWASRWDIYLTMDSAIPARVHWFSISNSLIIAVLISAVVLFMWKRMIRDILNYRRTSEDGEPVSIEAGDRCVNRLICLVFCGILTLFWFVWEWLVGMRQTTTTSGEVRGWKAVQADVFRPPSTSPMLLSVVCGTGAQLLCTAFLTILISAFGLISPARRGSLIISEIVLFVLMGPVSGYTTSRLFKAFDGQRRKLASTLAALGFPSVAAFTFTVIYSSTGIGKSTYSVGVWGIVIALWLGVMTPLVFVGAYLGYRQKPIQFPVKPSATPRAIPGNPWVRNFVIIPFSLLLCGILPFGAVFVELYFILSAIWFDLFYYSFGFLLLVFAIMALTCAVMAILSTYMQLYLEDYRWWWRSFNNAGAMAIYVFLYSIIYGRQLDMSNSEARVIYFGFMVVVALGLFCMTGFIGICASLWFTKTVYAAGMDDETDQPLVSASPEVQLAVVA